MTPTEPKEKDDEAAPLLDLLRHARRDAVSLRLIEITALVEAAIVALTSQAPPV